MGFLDKVGETVTMVTKQMAVRQGTLHCSMQPGPARRKGAL